MKGGVGAGLDLVHMLFDNCFAVAVKVLFRSCIVEPCRMRRGILGPVFWQPLAVY